MPKTKRLKTKRLRINPEATDQDPQYNYTITMGDAEYDVKRIRRGYFGTEIAGEVVRGSLGAIKTAIEDHESKPADFEGTTPPGFDPIKSKPTWLSKSANTLLAQLWIRKVIPTDMLEEVHECLDCAGLVGADQRVDREAVEQAVALYNRIQSL